MDFIIEFLTELIFEGVIEIGTNTKIPKCIRYPLLGIIILFYSALIIGLLILGIKVLLTNKTNGLIILGIDAILLIITILAFKKKLKEIKNQKNI